VPTILKKLISAEATLEAATCQPDCVNVTLLRPTQNWRQGEKPATDFLSFTRSAKCVFPSDHPLHHLDCYHFQSLEHVWFTIMTQMQP